MRAHPYRLIGKRLERALLRELEPILQDWAEAWLPQGVTASLISLTSLSDYCQAETEVLASPMVCWVDDNWCGVSSCADMLRLGFVLANSEKQVLDPQDSSPLLMEVARNAMIELARRILSGSLSAYDSIAFSVTKEALPLGAKQRGSGAIVVKITINGLSFDFFVSPATVERYLKTIESPALPKRPELDSFPTALGQQTLRAKFSLGSADLSLKDLATIRIGDVVMLDKRFDEPAAMCVNENSGACEGFIGIKGKRLAFRVSQLKQQNS